MKGNLKNLFVNTDNEKYIVEYTFIDFEYMIIGEKIKHKTHEDKNIS